MSGLLYCPYCQTHFAPSSHEVREHGVNCTTCRKAVPVFDQDTDATGNPGVGKVDWESLPPIPGYEIIGLLGRGGMGIVLDAKQSSLKRRVAIKVLPPEMANNLKFVERFQREARAMAALAHPNIVNIYEQSDSNSYFYFVMEFVEGPDGGRSLDLRTILDQRRLSVDEVKRFSLQIARAIGYAHQNGIIHRDIKPGNVLVDAAGNAKVADFGIAAIADAKSQLQLTLPNSALGTYDYMAPEQRDDAALVDQRSDVFSLGVMVYEMLTGMLPRGAYLPPSQLIENLDPKWDSLIGEALFPLKERRLPSMELFVAALQEIDTDYLPERDRHTAASTTGSLKCRACTAPVSLENRFCPSCQVSQYAPCRKCEKPAHTGLTFCPHCGEDLQARRDFEKFMAAAEKELSNSREQGLPPEEQTKHARFALQAARRAEKQDPNSLQAKSLARTAFKQATTLLVQRARDFEQQRELERARSLWKEVFDLDGKAEVARKRVEDIDRYLCENFKKIDAALSKGLFSKASERLRVITHEFPGNADAQNKLKQCEEEATEIKKLLQHKLPLLIAANHWFEVNKIVERVNSSGFQIAGFAEFAESVKQRLSRADEILAQSTTAAEQGDWSTLRRNAEELLKLTGDHPEGKKVLNVVQKNEFGPIREACDKQNWRQAKRLLQSLDKDSRKQLGKKLETLIDARYRAANSFVALIIWALAGGLLIGLLTFYAPAWGSRAFRTVIEPNIGQNPELRRALNGLFQQLAFWLPLTAGLFALRLFLPGRKHLSSFLGCLAMALVGAVLLTIGENAMAKLSLPWLTSAWPFTVIAVTASGYFSIASSNVPDPRVANGGIASLVGLFVAILFGALGAWYPDAHHVLCYFGLAVALMTLIRTIDHWWRGVLILLVGGVIAWLQQSGSFKSFSPFLTWSVVTTSLIGSTWSPGSAHPRSQYINGLISGMCGGLFGLCKPTPSLVTTLICWLVVNAVISRLSAKA